MTKRSAVVDDDPLDREIDFTKMQRVPNTFARDYGRSKNLRILDPELLEIFPDSDSVNEALHMIVRAAQHVQPNTISARRAAAPKSPKRKAS